LEVFEGSKNTVLQAKDIVISLNGQPAKYFDQAKTILKIIKTKQLLATVLRDQKK
jgi:regulator of sigma E protease